jgi:putative membrane protein
MGFLSKFIITILGNALGLFIATIYVPGFDAPTKPADLLIAAFILALINAFIRPFIKLALGPLIIITLGLGIIAVNAATIYLLSLVMPSVSFSGLLPLIYATLIIGIINLITAIFKKI